MSDPAVCRGCGERIDATHRPGCALGHMALEAADHAAADGEEVNLGHAHAVTAEQTDQADALRQRHTHRITAADPGPEPDRPPAEDIAKLERMANTPPRAGHIEDGPPTDFNPDPQPLF